MLLQRTFKKNYAESLLEAVRNGQDLDKYAKDHFDYDKEQVVMIPGIAFPEGLLEKMVPTPQGDFQSAVALYEAYPDLSPLQATDKTFWTYLTHVDLFSYVQARHSKVMDSSFEDSQYIIAHWFFPDKWMFRHSVASLWWFVYLTIDESRKDDKYYYTRFFFSNYEFRTNLLNFTIARLKEVLFGYFDFLIDYPEIMSQSFKFRNRYLTKHLNKLGGTHLLSILSREIIYGELLSIKDEALKINISSSKETEYEDEFDFKE